jgi:hypothetical protein
VGVHLVRKDKVDGQHPLMIGLGIANEPQDDVLKDRQW